MHMISYYKMYFSWILLFYIITPQIGNSQALFVKSVPLTTTFSTDDYRGGIQNWDICQDQRGFIYVANNFGLLEFDGSQWNNYTVPNCTRVRSILADSNRIYIGGQGQIGYFEPDSSGKLKFTTLQNLIAEDASSLDDVWSIYRYKQYVVFCSVNKLLFYDGRSIKILNPGSTLGYTFCTNDQLFSYCEASGLLVLKQQQLVPYPNGAFFKGKTIVAMLPGRSGKYMAVTLEGEISQVDSTGIYPVLPANNLLKGTTINTALALSNGTIAIGTQNSGIFILTEEGKLIRQLTNDTGLKSLTVASLHQDQFNNLWVGLNNGISYVALNSPFSLINEQVGVPGTGYTAMAFKDYVYLGTNNGLYYLSPGAKNYREVANASGQVYALSEVDDQLVLNHHRGAFTVDKYQAHLFFDQNGTWGMRKVPGHDTYICGAYDGFYLFEKRGEKFHLIQKISGMSESSRVFEFDSQDNLWMTHGYKGAYHFDLRHNLMAPKISFFDQKAGFPNNILINVYKIDGKLLFPAQHGIYIYQPTTRTFAPDSTFNRLLSRYWHVSNMTQDNFGNVYFIADNKLGLLRKSSTGTYALETDVFHRINKYLSDDLENINIIDMEHILIGAKDGFVVFNPMTNVHKPEKYLTYIRQVYLIGKTDSLLYGGGLQAHTDTLQLNNRHRAIRFNFSAPYFDGLEDIQYRYQLIGLDEVWSSYSQTTSKEYTNLSPGDYVFRVQAQNIYGQEGEITTLGFTILSPWYATTWAYSIYAILLLALVVMVLQRIKKKHDQEKSLLQQEKQQALMLKENEFHLASQRSFEQIMQLENEKLESEITYKNKRLAGVTMHLLTKNEFIIDVKKELKHAVIHKKNLVTEVNRVIKSIDRNITPDEDWQEFEQHFDQVHGDFIKRLKYQYPHLTNQETKLSAFLKMGMSTKEIASLLHNTVRGVEISRYRLRKKLDLDREVNLTDFMMNF